MPGAALLLPGVQCEQQAVIEGEHRAYTHIIGLRAGSPFITTAHLHLPTQYACVSNVCVVHSGTLWGTDLIISV